MIHLLLFLLAFAGFAMLCAARDRHQRDLLGRKLPAETSARLRRGGLFLLLLVYPLAGLALGWGYGAVEWLGQLSGGALLTVLLLSRCSARGAPGR
jgi:nitrate reductase NapE component